MKNSYFMFGTIVVLGLLQTGCGGNGGSSTSSGGGGEVIPDPPFEITAAGPQCYGADYISRTEGGYPGLPVIKYINCSWDCTTYKGNRGTLSGVVFSKYGDGAWSEGPGATLTSTPICN